MLIIGVTRHRRVAAWAVGAMLVGSFFACMAGIYELITQDAVLVVEVSGRKELITTATGGFRIQGFSGDSDNHVSNMLIFFGLGLAALFLVKTKAAKAAVQYLTEHDLLNKTTPGSSDNKFYVSDMPEKFSQLASRFMGQPVENITRIDVSKY